MTFKHTFFLSCMTLLLAVACGDDSKGEDETGSESAEGSETATTQPETSGESMTMGDGDGDPGDGDGDPGDGDGDPGDGDGDPGDGDGDPGDGDGEPSACAQYETQAECEGDAACQAVVGRPLQENGPDAPCLEPSEFIGCITMSGCGDAETWFCIGGNGRPYLVPDTCGPEGVESCDPGVQDPPECP